MDFTLRVRVVFGFFPPLRAGRPHTFRRQPNPIMFGVCVGLSRMCSMRRARMTGCVSEHAAQTAR